MFNDNIWTSSIHEEEKEVRPCQLDKQKELLRLKEIWFSKTKREIASEFSMPASTAYNLFRKVYGPKGPCKTKKRYKVILTAEQAKGLPKDSFYRAQTVGVSINTLIKYNIEI